MALSASFPVILPSETQPREFDAKLLLAGYLAERGHPVSELLPYRWTVLMRI
jgi:hypothetical protein